MRCTIAILGAAVACAPTLCTGIAPAQDAWLSDHAARITSINPDEPDSADLDAVVAAIGSRRIVVLAERTPGDGAVLWAKSRLARKLINEAGFSVIAFEAGLYDCRAMNTQFAAGTDYSAAAPIGLDPQWSSSGFMLTLFRDVWTSYFKPTPIQVCGFDQRFSGRRTSRQLPRELLDYLGSIDPHPLDKAQRRHHLTVLERLIQAVEQADDKAIVQSWEDLHHLLSLLKKHEAALVHARGRTDFEFWKRILEDAIANAERTMPFDVDYPGLSDDNARQERMSEHLAFLANQIYPDQRIIVWCSALTAMADAATVRVEPNQQLIDGYTPAGTRWRTTFGDELYVIAFDVGQGNCELIREGPLPAPAVEPGSLEEHLQTIDWPFLFIPFADDSPEWLRQSIPGNLLGLNPVLARRQLLEDLQFVSAVWPAQFDAVFFIRRSFPNHWEARPPDDAVHTVILE